MLTNETFESDNDGGGSRRPRARFLPVVYPLLMTWLAAGLAQFLSLYRSFNQPPLKCAPGIGPTGGRRYGTATASA
jgi:hypothetical protein